MSTLVMLDGSPAEQFLYVDISNAEIYTLEESLPLTVDSFEKYFVAKYAVK